MLPQPPSHRDPLARALTRARACASSPAGREAWLSQAPAAAVLPAALVQAPHVAGLVPAGEAVHFARRPSLWFVVLWRLDLLAAALLLTLAGVYVAQRAWLPISALGAVAAGVAAIALILLWGMLEWSTRLYVLTDQRAMRISGILRQTTIDLPLAHVQNVGMYKRLRERLFALGTPLLSSAAPVIGEISWDYSPQPAAMLQAVRDAIDRAGPRTLGPVSGGGL